MTSSLFIALLLLAALRLHLFFQVVLESGRGGAYLGTVEEESLQVPSGVLFDGLASDCQPCCCWRNQDRNFLLWCCWREWRG